MTFTPICPHCGQPVPMTRLGVPLSPMKARLFDIVRRAGPDGITGPAIIEDLGVAVSRSTLKVHIAQLNDKIEHTGHRIVGRGGYRLVRTQSGVAA